MVRYEDLHADPYRWFGGVLEMCGLDVSDGELREAVRLSSFENMSRMEEHLGIVKPHHGDLKIRFLRSGRVGSWRDELGEELVRVLDRRYGKLMAKLGYETGQV